MSIASTEWIKAKTAADRLGISVYQINKLALAGKIATKVDLGATPDYSVADVEKLAAERATATANA